VSGPDPPSNHRKPVEATRSLVGKRRGGIIQGGVFPIGAVFPARPSCGHPGHQAILWPSSPSCPARPSCGHPVAGGVCSCSSSPSTIPSLGVPTPSEAASRPPGPPKSFAPSEAGIFPSSELADRPPPCRAHRPHGVRSSTERKLPCCPVAGQSRRPRSPSCSAGPRKRAGADKTICQLLTTFDICQLLTIVPCPMFMSTNDNRVKDCPVG